MLTPIEKIVFLFLAATSLFFTQRFFRQMAQTINRGESTLNVADVPARLWRALEVTVTQRTVFRTRLSTSIMHGFVVWGFLFYFLIRQVAMFGQLYVFSALQIGKTMALFSAISIVLVNVLGIFLLGEVLSARAYLAIGMVVLAFIVLSATS